MTNLEFLAEAQKALDFKRQSTVEQYLLGILSIKVGSYDWTEAVKDAVRMEARINGPKEVSNAK